MKASFVWRNRVLLTSGVLVVIAIHLLSAGGRPADPVARPGAVLLEVLHPAQVAGERVADTAATLVHDYLALLDVRQENLRLKAEIARIKSERTRMVELETENRHLSELLGLKQSRGLDAVATNVVGSDATGLSHTLVLDQGESSGLKPGLAVVSSRGVVGKLIATSAHASRVLLITDHNSALDGFDQRSRARGIVAGVVDDGLIMKYVDRSSDVRAGDAVVTSGLAGIFPRGLLVGHVRSVAGGQAGLFLNVIVEPAVDFTALEQVLVVRNSPPTVDGRRGG